jgi:hypothetical protein
MRIQTQLFEIGVPLWLVWFWRIMLQRCWTHGRALQHQDGTKNWWYCDECTADWDQ